MFALAYRLPHLLALRVASAAIFLLLLWLVLWRRRRS